MKKRLVVLLLCVAVVISTVLVGSAGVPVRADTHYVGSGGSIQAAIDAASPGDTVNLAAGTYVLTSQVDLNKANLTLVGAGSSSTIVQVSGSSYGFYITATGVAIQALGIQKTDKTGQNIIYVGASNVSISNSDISGQFAIGDAEVSRAIEVAGGLSGLNFSGNTIHSLRQPAYVNGVTTGTISNNYVYLTRGWVVAEGNLTFTGNTWGTGANANVYDIAVLSTVSPTYYADIPAMAAANNSAFIEDQRTTPYTLSIVYVDGSVAASGDGTARSPVKTMAEGITRVVSGGTVHVAAGTYTGTVTIGKSLSLLGARAGVDARGRTGSESIVDAGLSAANPSAIIVTSTAANMTIDGFTIVGSRGAVKSDSVNLQFLNNIVQANASTYGTNTAALVYIDGGANQITVRRNDISPTPVLSVGTNCLRLAITSAAASVVVDNNWLRNATHETAYQGSGQGIGIDSSGASITMTNNSFYDNGGDGMFVGTGATFGILTGTGNSFYNNAYWGLNLGSGITGTMSIKNGNFYGNGAGGLQNNSTNIIDATNNWWGDASGPYNAASNPSGLGNAVSSNVLFVPWTGMVTPTVASATPNQGTQGQTLSSVVITGTNFTGASAVSFGAGITVSSFTVNSATQITANITIATGAIVGARDVSVTTSGGIGTRTGGFTVVASGPPAAPVLISPAAGAYQGSTSVTFTWEAVAGATQYYLIVSTSPTLNVSRTFEGYVTGTSWTVTGFPNNGTTYYWSAWSIDDGVWCIIADGYANTRAFINRGENVPAAPVLTSPAPGAYQAGTSVTFTWEAVAGATQYYLIVSTSPTLNVFRTFEGYVTGTSRTVTGFPNNGTTYYWSVWSIDDGVWCIIADGYANTRAFINRGEMVPAAPVLTSPAAGAYQAGTSVTFTWEAVAGATQYYLIVSTSPTLNVFRTFEGYVTGTSQTVTGFPNNGTTYYWSAWSIDDGVWCWLADGYANTRSFVNRA